MNSASRLYPFFAAILGIAIAIFIYLYVPEGLKVVVFLLLLLFAIAYTMFRLFFRRENDGFSLKKLWKEVIDFLYGL